MNLKELTKTSIFIALATVLTMFPHFATPTGYVHFGDSIIYIASAFLGPIPGALVGSIGHSLSDIFSGYPIYAPATFIIKGIMGFVIGKILYKNINIQRIIVAGIFALFIVTLGYFVAEIPMFGLGAAMVSLVSSPVQWLMSIAAFAILTPIINKIIRKI